jgi:4'-phosphopantetheinyl transferase
MKTSDGLTNWSVSPDNMTLSKGKIDVWAVPLDSGKGYIAECNELLSKDEISRARRFHFEADQRRFTIARGCLRKLIGRYLKRDAHSIVFQTNEYGKPRLAGENDMPLCFNISHSGEMAVMAFTYSRELGVDIELIRENIDHQSLSERFFSEAEATILKSLADEDRLKCFYETWTRKEAFIKAVGKGLSIPLDQFDVSVGVGVSPALVDVRYDCANSSGWFMSEITLNESFAGAIAVEGKDAEIRRFRI